MINKIESLYLKLAKHNSLLDLNYYIGSNYLIENYTISELEKVYKFSRKRKAISDIELFLIYTIILIINEEENFNISKINDPNLKIEIEKELKRIDIENKRKEIAKNPENARVEELLKKEAFLEKELKKVRFELLSSNSKDITDNVVKKSLKKFKSKFEHFID